MRLSQMFSHWEQVRAGLLATVDQFNNDELSYVPFEASWSAGQIMLHIAGAEEGWFRFVVARERTGWPGYRTEDYPTAESIKALLDEVHTRTEEYLATLDISDLDRVVDAPWGSSMRLGWIIWHVLEHEIHHRGELSLVLGILGREGLDV